MIEIATERLRLAPLVGDDADDFAGYRRIPAVARYQSWDEHFDVDDARRILDAQPADLPDAGDWLQLGIRDSSTGVLLGDVAVHRDLQPDTWELGVTLAPAAQGRGFATEALDAVIARCFAEGAHRVWAQCDERNAPMRRVLTRLGLRREATLLEADWCKGEWTTVEVFAVLASERSGS